MRRVFADSCYWIALLNDQDDLHAKALEVSEALGEFGTITSESVMLEFFNHFSGYNEFWRNRAVESYREIVADPNILILPHKTDKMEEAVQLYGNRLDKHYSLTDCLSIIEMRHNNLSEILTNDHHFTQEGLIALMKQ